jgi:acetoin utilization protein AcuB
MNVGKRISSPVITVSPDLPISEALALMSQEKIRHVPVVQKGKMVGIVTKNDLLNASPSKATSLSIWEINYLLNKIIVADVMSKKVITTTEDTPIEEAARIMSDNKVSCLPIMRGKEVVGIITETDLFKVFLELLGARHKGVRLTVQVANEPGMLAKISQTIYEAGGNIIALGTFAGESFTSSLMTIKVEDVEEKKLKKLIEPLVVRITDIRTL